MGKKFTSGEKFAPSAAQFNRYEAAAEAAGKVRIGTGGYRLAGAGSAPPPEPPAATAYAGPFAVSKAGNTATIAAGMAVWGGKIFEFASQTISCTNFCTIYGRVRLINNTLAVDYALTPYGEDFKTTELLPIAVIDYGVVTQLHYGCINLQHRMR